MTSGLAWRSAVTKESEARKPAEAVPAAAPIAQEMSSHLRMKGSAGKWSRIDPAIPGPVDWRLAFSIPFGVLVRAAGARPPRPGDRWRGNFYKCGDDTPAPHWIAWAPVDALDFHLPRCFGDLVFGA